MAKKKTPQLPKLTPQQLRFVYLYLGHEGGKAWSNATLSYFYAYYGETAKKKDKDGNWTKEYKTANVEGLRLVVKPSIKAVMDDILLESGYKPENIKKGFAKLANQQKNLPVALAAHDRMAKITGVIKDDGLKVNIPELEKLTETIRNTLSGN